MAGLFTPILGLMLNLFASIYTAGHPEQYVGGLRFPRSYVGDNYLKPQDVQITSIELSDFLSDLRGKSKWRHGFFRQRNLICGFNASKVHLFPQNIFTKERSEQLFEFRVDEAEEIIVDTVVFHRDDGFARLGIVTRSKSPLRGPGLLREFKIGHSIEELFKISLEGTPFAVKFVCGFQGCAYTILNKDQGEIKVRHRYYSTEDISIIEIRLADPISLSSVQLRGFRHLVVGSQSQVYVYRLDHFVTSAKLTLTIPLDNIRSVGAFRSGPSAYLALTSEIKQTIIELRSDGGWKSVRELSILMAVQFLPIYSVSFRTHILALTTQSPSMPLVLFLFSGPSNVLHEIRIPSIAQQFVILENSVAGFSRGQQNAALLFFDILAKRSVYVEIGYSLPNLRAPLHQLKQEVATRIAAAKDKLIHQRSVINEAKLTIKLGAAKQATLHRIPRSAKFNEIDVEGALHTVLEPKTQIGVVHSDIVIGPHESIMAEISAKLSTVQKQIGLAKEVLQYAIFKNSSQAIQGPKLVSGSVSCPMIKSHAVNVDRVGREPAQEVVDSLYFIDEGSLLKRLIFKADLSTPSVTVSTMNGLNVPQDIALTEDDNQLVGTYNFTRGLSLRMNSLAHGPLGPLRHTSNLVKVSNSGQFSARRQDFDEVIVRDRVECQSVNDVNPKELTKTLLNTHSKQIIQTPIILHGFARMQSLRVNSVNGLSISTPMKRFVYPDVPAVISGKKKFNFVTLKRGLQVPHTLNELRIPGDLMLRHVEQRVTAPKKFAGGLKASSIIQSGLLNNFSYPQQVASLTWPSTIAGRVEFLQGVHFNSIHSQGLVDDLNIDEFMKRRNKSLHSRPIVFHKTVEADQVEVKGSLDGEDIRKLWDGEYRKLPADIIPASLVPQHSLEISGEKIFSNEVVADQVYSPLINGFNVHEDLAKCGKLIRGRKIIMGNLHVNALSSAQSIINGINVKAAFSERVTLTTPQTISKPLFFRGIRANNITIEGLFNGTRFPADFITTNLPEFIPGDLRFNQLVIRSKVVQPHEKVSTPHIAGISNALKHRIPLDAKLDLDFLKFANVESRLVDAEFVDGVNFTKFSERVLRNDQDRITLTGHNVFERLIIRAPFSTPSVNGFDLAGLNKLAVSTVKPTTIRVPISFQNRMIVKGPMRTSNVNSQNSDVLNNIARSNENNISAPVLFKRNVRSEGPVDALLVNGGTLPRDFLTVSTVQTVTSPLAFRGTLSVKRKIDGRPTINGVDLPHLEKSIARVSSEGQIFVNSSLIFQASVKLERDVHASDVNGEDLKKLVAHASCMNDGVINTLVVNGSLELTHGALVHNYNGRRNLPQLMANMIFSDSKKYKLTNTTFHNLKVENTVQCEEMQHEGFLNGLQLESILEKAIPTSYGKSLHIPGSLVLNSPATIGNLGVDGLINGIRFPEGVIQRCTKCPAQKLQNVTVHLMDVANIRAESSDHPSFDLWNTIKKNKVVTAEEILEQILKGQRVVDKLIVDGNLQTETINGKPFTERLVRTDGFAVLESPVLASASFENLTLQPSAQTNCSFGGLACAIRALRERNCFDWHTELPHFDNVIFERGVHTKQINGVELKPAQMRSRAALNTLSSQLVEAQKALEKVHHVNEHLLDC